MFERLVKDSEQRQKVKERESVLEFTYRDNQIVKKDVFVEFDFVDYLRSDDRHFSPNRQASRIEGSQK